MIRPSGVIPVTADDLTRDFAMEEAIYHLASSDDRAALYRTLCEVRNLPEEASWSWTSQTFSPDELRGVLRVCEDHGATEVTVTDWRPDAPLIVLELQPGSVVAVIDDAGVEVDPMGMEL